MLTQAAPVIVKMDVMGEDCDNAGPGCNKYARECFQLITYIPDILTTLKSLQRPGYSAYSIFWFPIANIYNTCILRCGSILHFLLYVYFRSLTLPHTHIFGHLYDYVIALQPLHLKPGM